MLHFPPALRDSSTSSGKSKFHSHRERLSYGSVCESSRDRELMLRCHCLDVMFRRAPKLFQLAVSEWKVMIELLFIQDEQDDHRNKAR